MLLSVLLAQIFGLYFILMAIVMVAKVDRFKFLVERLDEDSYVVFMGSAFSCLLGISLVVVHTYWALDWQIVITLIAWAILVKSLFWLLLPSLMVACTKKFYLGIGYYVSIAFMVFLGIFLLYQGYSFMFTSETVIIKFN